MYIKLILVLFILNCFCQITVAEELIQVEAAIHISSTVSDGKLSIDEIIKIAKQNDIKIVILADHDFMKWEYGLWPLRRIIKKTIETNSIYIYGISRYLKEIEEIQKKNPDLVLIPGVECAPFYYWSGNLFKDNLKIHNWHKHIMVIGLEGAGDYRNLPSISKGFSLSLPFTFRDIYRFWPILAFIVGILCLRKREFRYKDLGGHWLGFFSRKWQIFGICLIILSLLFIFNDFPFCGFKYDQYHGNQGIEPYQNLIDYVNTKGGLTFWSHPEAEYISQRGKIEIETREHSQDLLETRDYTGFALFYEGYKAVGSLGGIWDEVLKEYCQGRRKKPVWAMGALSFDQKGDIGEYINNLRTTILVSHLSRKVALKALREGRMYVSRGRKMVLDEFIIQSSASDVNGMMGDTIDLNGSPIVKIKGHFLDESPDLVNIDLIRDGVIIKRFEVISPFEITYEDEDFDKDKKTYYRLVISCPGGILVANPIFIKFRY